MFLCFFSKIIFGLLVRYTENQTNLLLTHCEIILGLANFYSVAQIFPNIIGSEIG